MSQFETVSSLLLQLGFNNARKQRTIMTLILVEIIFEACKLVVKLAAARKNSAFGFSL